MQPQHVHDHQQRRRAATACCSLFTLATLGLWILLLAPAWLLAGPSGLEGLSYATALCIVPGWLIFWMSSLSGLAQTQLAMVVLGGSALRLLFVLAGTLVIHSFRPGLGFRGFLLWILVFYLATLLVETLLMVRDFRTEHGRPQGNST